MQIESSFRRVAFGHARVFARSASASSASSAVELATLAVFHVVGVPIIAAFALVQLLGIGITFVLNKYWAFGAGTSDQLVREGAKALAVVAGSFALNMTLSSLGAYGLHVSPFLAYVGAQVAVYVCWNFPLNRWWVFPVSEAIAVTG